MIALKVGDPALTLSGQEGVVLSWGPDTCELLTDSGVRQEPSWRVFGAEEIVDLEEDESD